MENQTYRKEFQLMMFSASSDYNLFTFVVFFLLYIFGILINSLIITVIYNDDQLHTPMYLFLCNLALVDICYTTTIVPKLLYMLLSRNNIVTVKECFTQMLLYFVVGATEDLLIFVMAYDRYVAICHPLHYHSILSRKNCILITTGTWISGCLSAVGITVSVSHMSFCQSRCIQQFFCDPKALFNISCGGRKEFYIIIYLELLVCGCFPLTFSVTSYIKIFRVISHIKSVEGKKKAFSTCSSHLTVVLIYYTTSITTYMMPPTENSKVLEPIFAAMYSVVAPMINPLIYGLRNKDVKIALLRLIRVLLNS